MNQFIKYIILGLILVACIVALVYTFSSPPKALAPASSESIKSAMSDKTSNASTSSLSPVQSKLDQCIAEVKASANYSQSVKGLIIVSFSKDTSFDQAVSIIKSQSLNFTETAEARDNFGTTFFLEVSVPKGAEAEWICKLGEVSGVRRASLDLLFNLHE